MQKTQGMLAKASSGTLVRALPRDDIKQPIRKFEDTFSAEKIVLKKFFLSE